MNESPDALRQTIASTQKDLSHNLEVLESKGQDLVDWRAHVDKRPLAMLGVAFVGGALAAAVLGGGGSSRRSGATESLGSTSPRAPKPHRESNESWNRLRSGLGVAAAGIAMEAISKALPGLKEHVIEPVRSALRPEEKLPFPDRRKNGAGMSKPQGNGYTG